MKIERKIMGLGIDQICDEHRKSGIVPKVILLLTDDNFHRLIRDDPDIVTSKNIYALTAISKHRNVPEFLEESLKMGYLESPRKKGSRVLICNPYIENSFYIATEGFVKQAMINKLHAVYHVFFLLGASLIKIAHSSNKEIEKEFAVKIGGGGNGIKLETGGELNQKQHENVDTSLCFKSLGYEPKFEKAEEHIRKTGIGNDDLLLGFLNRRRERRRSEYSEKYDFHLKQEYGLALSALMDLKIPEYIDLGFNLKYAHSEVNSNFMSWYVEFPDLEQK